MNERESIRKMLRERPRVREFLTELEEHGQLRSSDTMTDAELEEEMIMVAAPMTDITGSVQVRCGCGAHIWLSPSSQEMVARHRGPIRYVCLHCFMKQLKEMESNGSHEG